MNIAEQTIYYGCGKTYGLKLWLMMQVRKVFSRYN